MGCGEGAVYPLTQAVNVSHLLRSCDLFHRHVAMIQPKDMKFSLSLPSPRRSQLRRLMPSIGSLATGLHKEGARLSAGIVDVRVVASLANAKGLLRCRTYRDRSAAVRTHSLDA